MIPQLPRTEYVPPDGQAIQQFKTFWRRAFATLVDGGIMILVASALMYLFGRARQPLWFLVYLGCATVVNLCYTAFLTYRYGGTPGKLVFGIRVVRFSGLERISLGQSILREVPNVTLSMATVLLASLALAYGGADGLSRYLERRPPTVYSQIGNYLTQQFHKNMVI